MKGVKKVFFIDSETYKLYDGTKECEEEIIGNMGYESSVDFFEKNKKKGMSYPVLLGTKEFTLGGLSQVGIRKKRAFKTKESMKKKILELTIQAMKEGKNAVFYVHNGDFDMPRIFGKDYTEFNLIHKYSGSKIWVLTPKVELNLKCKKCGYEWVFEGGKEWTKCPKCNEKKKVPCGAIRDTMNFIGRNTTKALANIGKELGIEKLETPLEIKEADELKEYLGRDLQIIEKFILSFYDMKKMLDWYLYGERSNGQMRPPITGSNFSMTQFQTYTRKIGFCKSCKSSFVMKKLNEKRECPNCKNKVSSYSAYLGIKGQMHKTRFRKEIRDAFKGGVNKCFKKGRFEDVRVFDTTGLYPSVTKYMPSLDPLSEKKIENPNEYKTEEILKMHGIAKAEVEFPTGRKLGLLPMRWKGWGIYFPICKEKPKTYRGTWTLDELKWASNYGYKIKKFEWVITYKELPFNCLWGFEEKLFKLRKESSGIFKKVIIKLLMNGLLLKFAQYKPKVKYNKCIKNEVEKWEKEGWEITGESPDERKWILVKKSSPKFPRYAIPIWSVYVTAYSRMAILEQAMKIEYDDLLYIDTDSLHCKNWEKYMKVLRIGNNLGEFKVEFEDEEHPLTADYVKEKWYTILNNKGEIVHQATSGAKGGDLTSEQMHGLSEIIVLRNLSIARWIREKSEKGTPKYKEEDIGMYEKIPLWVDASKRKMNIEDKFPEGYEEFRKDNLEESEEDEYEDPDDLIE